MYSDNNEYKIANTMVSCDICLYSIINRLMTFHNEFTVINDLAYDVIIGAPNTTNNTHIPVPLYAPGYDPSGINTNTNGAG